jgi:hypothetical protein
LVALAYRDLATCRPEYGHRIPWTAIHEYVLAKGISERARFEHLIGALDDEHLSMMERRMTERRKAHG